MITLHCSCGQTLTTGLGPASVTCTCGRVHKLPSLPAAPVAAIQEPIPPAPAVTVARVVAPPTEGPPPAKKESSVNPYVPAKRQAIHDGPALRPEGRFEQLRNPAVAGAISVGVLLIACVAAWGLRARANRIKAQAGDPAKSGTECVFEGAGIAFHAPAGWRLAKSENMVFEFEAPEGTVSVTVLHVSQEKHADRLRGTLPEVEFASSDSELSGADCLAAKWDKGEAASWWMERSTHRLWVLANGRPGARQAARAVFDTLRLTTPAEPK